MKYVIVSLAAMGLLLGCVPPCEEDEVSATFTLSQSEVDDRSGGAGVLSFDECASYCEENLMQAYPEDTEVIRCEPYASDSTTEYECAFVALAVCG